MKTIKIIIFTLISANAIQACEFDTLVEISGLIISNLPIGSSETQIQKYKDLDSLVKHRINCRLEKKSAENDFFKKWLFFGSNFALFNTSKAILSTDTNPIYKYSSVAVLAGTNYLFNSMFKTIESQKREKVADFFFIQATKDPEALKNYLTKEIYTSKQKNTLSNNLFGINWNQRITAFENAVKIREAQKNKTEIPNLYVYGKSLNNID